MSDLGWQTVEVLTDVDGIDDRGNPARVPSTAATVVSGCSVQPLAATETAQLGLQTATVLKLFCLRFPGGAGSRVRWSGRTWDVLGEPQRHGETEDGYDLVLLRTTARGAQ